MAIRALGRVGNHRDCDSFVKRIWKENTGTNCSPLLTLNTPANYQLSGVHKAPWRATDVAVSSIPSFTPYAHKLMEGGERYSPIRLFPPLSPDSLRSIDRSKMLGRRNEILKIVEKIESRRVEGISERRRVR